MLTQFLLEGVVRLKNQNGCLTVLGKVRGEAYLRQHQDEDARAEFQKILDHRGIVASDPVGAVARLQLARAYTKMGDTSKAKAAYTDLLSTWKDADRNLARVSEAQAEFARLQ